MTESKQPKSSEPKVNDQPTGTADRPAASQPATAAATPATFGDGSTQQEQQELVKAAEEANAETKRFADAEREARSQ